MDFREYSQNIGVSPCNNLILDCLRGNTELRSVVYFQTTKTSNIIKIYVFILNFYFEFM